MVGDNLTEHERRVLASAVASWTDITVGRAHTDGIVPIIRCEDRLTIGYADKDYNFYSLHVSQKGDMVWEKRQAGLWYIAWLDAVDEHLPLFKYQQSGLYIPKIIRQCVLIDNGNGGLEQDRRIYVGQDGSVSYFTRFHDAKNILVWGSKEPGYWGGEDKLSDRELLLEKIMIMRASDARFQDSQHDNMRFLSKLDELLIKIVALHKKGPIDFKDLGPAVVI